jgi:dTMP kinase
MRAARDALGHPRRVLRAPSASRAAANARAIARLPVPAGPWNRYACEGAPCGGSAPASTARACGCASMPGRALVWILGRQGGHRSRRYGAGVARGRLITIEGLDGAGKSTLAQALAEEIAARGFAVELLREPGGVPVSERIRELVKDPRLAGLRAHRGAPVCRRPRPARRRAPGTAARRAASCCSTASSTPRWPTRAPGARWGSSRCAAINRFATGPLEPDRTLLLRISPPPAARASASARSRPTGSSARAMPSSSGSPPPTTSWRAPEPERIRTIDAAQPPAQVLEAALAAVADLLGHA